MLTPSRKPSWVKLRRGDAERTAAGAAQPSPHPQWRGEPASRLPTRLRSSRASMAGRRGPLCTHIQYAAGQWDADDTPCTEQSPVVLPNPRATVVADGSNVRPACRGPGRISEICHPRSPDVSVQRVAYSGFPVFSQSPPDHTPVKTSSRIIGLIDCRAKGGPAMSSTGRSRAQLQLDAGECRADDVAMGGTPGSRIAVISIDAHIQIVTH